jgi:hypothetical protein
MEQACAEAPGLERGRQEALCISRLTATASASQLSRNNTDESVPELAAANVEPYKKFWNFYMQKQNESGNRKGTQDENGNWVDHENASSRKDLERYDSTQAEVQDPAVPEEGGNNTGSDARIKNIIASMTPYYSRKTLSDNRLKHIIASMTPYYSRETLSDNRLKHIIASLSVAYGRR